MEAIAQDNSILLVALVSITFLSVAIILLAIGIISLLRRK